MTNPGQARPRLVSVVNRFPSESETFIERKARSLVAAGFDVTVAAHHVGRSSEAPGAGPVPMLQLPGVRSPRTWQATLSQLLREPDARHRAAPFVRNMRPGHWLIPVAAGGYDLIHFEFSGIAAQVADLLPGLRPAALAVSCRGAAEQIAPHREPDRAQRLRTVFEAVDLIHCVSDDMAQTVQEFGATPDKILVNRPAVDTARWAGIARVSPDRRGTPDKPLRVLSVARLHWKKAFDDAVRAIAAVQAAGLTVDYRIAGEGPEREKLLYLRHSLGLDEQVTLLGWQTQQQVAELFGWADLFLLPSLSEGISNSALEALAAGLPVISTRCGGMDEVLAAPTSGRLVEVGDIAAMSTAIQRLADPVPRQELSHGGAAAARARFDLDRQANVFAQAYRSLLATQAPAKRHDRS